MAAVYAPLMALYTCWCTCAPGPATRLASLPLSTVRHHGHAATHTPLLCSCSRLRCRACVTLAVFTLAVSCAGDVMSCALQGGRPGLDDLSSLDAALHSNLLAVKTCPADQVEHLCLTFAAEQQLLGKVRTSAFIYIATIYTLLCFTNHEWASLALLQQTAQACA